MRKLQGLLVVGALTGDGGASDTTAPTVEITSTSEATVYEAFSATITFSEAVTGFTVDDITAGNATLSEFAGSGVVYTVTVTPTAEGAVTLDIDADVCEDAAGNPNEAAAQFSVDYGTDMDHVIRAMSGLIAYWPLSETTGTVADNAEGTAALDGTYGGTNLSLAGGTIAGASVPLFASTAYMDALTAGLASAFNGAEGTILVWIDVDAAFWSDGAEHWWAHLRGDSGYYIQLFKHITTNNIRLTYAAGGVSKLVWVTSAAFGALTGPTLVALTWSKSTDEVKGYINGAQIGSTATGLGTWSGLLTIALFGANSTGGTYQHVGALGHVALYNQALTLEQIEDIYGAENPS